MLAHCKVLSADSSKVPVQRSHIVAVYICILILAWCVLNTSVFAQPYSEV